MKIIYESRCCFQVAFIIPSAILLFPFHSLSIATTPTKMHGKKREEYKAKMRDPKTAKVLSQKAQQWHVLMKELGDRRLNKDPSETTLPLLAKVLLVNPDPMNLWNQRRELILNELQSQSQLDESKSTDEAKTTLEASIVHRERALTTTALKQNPKAYGAWFHRKWILQKFRPSATILEEELGLTSTFLKADERNFHCWNYRRFVVACLGNSWDGEWTVVGLQQDGESNKPLMGQQVVEPSKQVSSCKLTIPAHLIASEFEFTTDKITQNFSNFSAFHYRSQLLDLAHASAVGNDEFRTVMEERLDQEFQLVEDAVCTEPDDQTCWWYHSILLDLIQLIDNNEETTNDKLMDRFTDRLLEQADLFRELLEDSPNSKWVILGLFKVLQILETTSANEEEPDDASGDSKTERETLLEKLKQIDPYRANRYEYLKH